jgi:hypothetical protein
MLPGGMGLIPLARRAGGKEAEAAPQDGPPAQWAGRPCGAFPVQESGVTWVRAQPGLRSARIYLHSSACWADWATGFKSIAPSKSSKRSLRCRAMGGVLIRRMNLQLLSSSTIAPVFFTQLTLPWEGCGSHSGQIFENLIEQAVEGCPKRGRGDAQNGD